jgi:hypothetical protein
MSIIVSAANLWVVKNERRSNYCDNQIRKMKKKYQPENITVGIHRYPIDIQPGIFDG